MDFTLVTGQPGASKTLNTIKAVEERRLKESRPVYYINIKELTLDWIEMQHPDSLADNPDAITPHSWFNAPEGSIILIDECHYFYPAISMLSKQPDYIMRFSTYRHGGYSLYLITQSPSLVNKNLREWVQPHIHYRRLWGGFKAYEYTNEECIDNPRDVRKLAKNAILKKVKIDKSYFGKYKSSEQHNKNKRINLRVLMYIIIPLLILPLSLYYLFDYFSSVDEEKPSDIQSEPALESSALDDSNASFLQKSFDFSNGSEDSFNPMVAYIPRIEAMPETAPAYDDLRKPKTFPKPQCVHNPANDVCKCYTQQATLMHDYPKELCIDYVKNGRFDPTYIRVSHRQEGSSRHNQPIARQVSQPVKQENHPQESKVLQAYDFSSM